jgi:hypothetical protein
MLTERFTIEFRYWLSRKVENSLIWAAKHLPKELRKWVVVMAACRACGDTKSPSEIGYREMYDAS